ncbi:DUF3052 family protein [Streptomyces sp. NPDC005930]|uniref:DUF3052 family protein n=1 Tax=Streptomyces sp. NPDC005930 TaxID=3364736 RepID=UPI0036937C3E
MNVRACRQAASRKSRKAGLAITTAEISLGKQLGLTPGQTVEEIGWNDDCDDELCQSVEEVTGTELLDEGTAEVVDVVLRRRPWR